MNWIVQYLFLVPLLTPLPEQRRQLDTFHVHRHVVDSRIRWCKSGEQGGQRNDRDFDWRLEIRAEAIARAMKDAELQKSLLAAQKELEKMMPGSGVATETFRQDLANISQVVEMRETAAGKKKAAAESLDKSAMPPISAALAAAMKTVESDARTDVSVLTLGTRAEATKKLTPDNLPPNAMVAPLVPDKIDDLIGKLLDEADEMSEKFDSLTVNSGLISADPGEVGKLAGRMNSSGATSTTGNKKPPTANVPQRNPTATTIAMRSAIAALRISVGYAPPAAPGWRERRRATRSSCPGRATAGGCGRRRGRASR